MIAKAALASPPQARLLLLALLGGIFTIKVPVLIAAGLLGGILLFAWNTATRGAIDRLSLLILANLLFWLLSGFTTGALSFGMLAEPAYYSNEGRVFLTYFAFLTLAACTATAGYRLYRSSRAGPVVSRTVSTEPSGTISPCRFLSRRRVRSDTCRRNRASACTFTCHVRPNRLKSLMYSDPKQICSVE